MTEEVLLRNNTGSKSKKAIVDGFVVRLKEFNEIFENLKRTSSFSNKQHYLIIGQRGAGKTSLMHRLNYAVEDEDSLSEKVYPIIFTEEQYFLSELVNLWENIGNHLEDQFGWENITDQISKIIAEDKDYEIKVYNFICKKLADNKRSLILFIENLNVFFNKLDDRELNRIKNILANDSCIRLIGTTTAFNDGYVDFSDKTFDFFKIIQLEGLDKEECETLLLTIAEQFGQQEKILDVIENYPGRIESLRRLTGGIPRTISYLFQIFLDNENGKAIKDLYILIDTLTLLYKSELDQLSTQQQKVIDVIARKWDAIPVKDIVLGTRLESKNISKILSALEKNQLIEKVQTSSKNHLYRIKERFMNIWYLMRFGRKNDRENVIWLVKFFDTWFEKKELDEMISAHIDSIKDGRYDVEAAVDMGNTFLSCTNVSEDLKQKLLEATKSILPERLLKNVKSDVKAIGSDIEELIKLNRFDEAIEALKSIKEHNAQYFKLASTIYLLSGDYAKSADAAKELLKLDEQNSIAAMMLGIIHEDYLTNLDLAIQYYKQSLSQKSFHPYAASRLADIAIRVQGDTNSAINYHRMAIKKGFKPSLISLAKIYIDLGDFQEAESLLLDAVKRKARKAYVTLAKLYAKFNQQKKAKAAFLSSINADEDDALFEFGRWNENKKKPDYDAASRYYKQAIKAGTVKAYGYLGMLYDRKLKDIDEALILFNEGLEKGDGISAHRLAHYYADQEDYEKSDELFVKAANMGEKVAILCLATNIYKRGRKDKKKFILNIIQENMDSLKGYYPIELIYARLLLWNNEIEKSLEILHTVSSKIADLQIDTEDNIEEFRSRRLMSELFNYFLLLLAKKEYQIALEIFNDNTLVDFKSILKPFYFVLMEALKKDYPMEYLKAGDEFQDTTSELKTNINRLQKLL